MQLYIVIHIICEKPDSVDFPGKVTNFFDTKTYFKSQISASFRYFFFLQADSLLSNGSLIPSHFQIAIIQIPPMAIDGPSMPIGKSCDGHRCPSEKVAMAIDAHRWD